LSLGSVVGVLSAGECENPVHSGENNAAVFSTIFPAPCNSVREFPGYYCDTALQYNIRIFYV